MKSTYGSRDHDSERTKDTDIHFYTYTHCIYRKLIIISFISDYGSYKLALFMGTTALCFILYFNYNYDHNVGLEVFCKCRDVAFSCLALEL